MLSRAAGRSLLVRSLQAPAARSTTASFRIATSTQWTRSLATNRRGGSKKPVDYSRTPGSPGAPRSSSIGQQSTGAGAAFAASRSAPTSKEQAESSQKASQDQNTAPQSSGNASKQAVSEAEEPAYTGPLPDLTQGIPSTLEFEAIERARQTEGSELNVTEDPAHPGGRPRGELPASAYVSSSEKKRLRVANYMYLAFAAFSVTAYTFLGRNWESCGLAQKLVWVTN
jgi:import inner membrane translocase subunit TIM50